MVVVVLPFIQQPQRVQQPVAAVQAQQDLVTQAQMNLAVVVAAAYIRVQSSQAVAVVVELSISVIRILARLVSDQLTQLVL